MQAMPAAAAKPPAWRLQGKPLCIGLGNSLVTAFLGKKTPTLLAPAVQFLTALR
jgi:hypothetical protein